MLTAKIRFLTNTLVTDLSCRSSELQDSLQDTGILIPPSSMQLSNKTLLQIRLIPNDDIGAKINSLVNTKSDTLGSVQRLCRFVYCMNERNRNEFLSNADNGSIKTVKQGIKLAEKMREKRLKNR